MSSEPTDLLIAGGTVVTLDSSRTVIEDGAVAVAAGEIVEVGAAGELSTCAAGRTIDARGMLVTPGLVNAHVHLTGPSLFPGMEPGESPIADHFPRWVIPAHAAGEAEDERAAARLVALQMLRAGTTSFIEAGVCRFPETVLEAINGLGVRGALGVWAGDAWPVPGEGPLDAGELLERIEHTLDLGSDGDLVRAWPSLIGHDGCSDELYLGAAALARERGLGWTFHMSATEMDRDFFREAHGADPLVHLDRLGVLDESVTIAHAIHLTREEEAVLSESGATVAFCPGAALRLCTGVSRAGRHPDLPHIALGTDTQNGSNHLDVLRAAGLACDLYGELRGERAGLAAERALEWATLGGARALRLESALGSLEPGKRADIAVFDPGTPVFNVANSLVHGAPRAVHVVVNGRLVLNDGHVEGEDAILGEAAAAAERVRARADLPARTGWAASLST